MGIFPITGMDTLTYMYKNLPPNSTRKLENFNGVRRLSIFRGKDYMNKITQKLDSNLMLIRTLKNVGTKDNPELVTGGVMLRAPKGDVFVYYDAWGDSQKGIHVDVNRRDGYLPYQRKYNSCMEMRQDKTFLSILEKITGKKIL